MRRQRRLDPMTTLLCLCVVVLPIVHASILIKNGVVVNADRQFKGDVLVENGRVAKVGEGLEGREVERVVDAAGLYVMPGGIDPHTHLEMPFMGTIACDDFFSGQAAALAGGTTMHIDFALPSDGDLMKGYRRYKEKSKKSCMDYGLHMAVTAWNAQAHIEVSFVETQSVEQVSKDVAFLVEEGINSFKFFMAYKGSIMVTDDILLEGMERCRELGALPMVHAENGDAVALGQERVFRSGITAPVGHALSRPSGLEAEATHRAIRLADFVDVPLYVVHVTSEAAADEIWRAKRRGRPVIGEALSVGLAMNGDKIKDPDFKIAAQYVMSPPIREDADTLALKQGLQGGGLDLVGTDHAVFNSTQKAKGRHDFRLIPNGVNGIEERLHVVWEEMVNTGLMRPSEFVRVVSTQAAKIFNIYPQKGVIQEGSDADIVLLDPDKVHTIRAASHHSRMDTNIYEGKEIKGEVVMTISRGRIVWEDGRLRVEEGSGRFVKLPPFPYLFPPDAAGTEKPRSWASAKEEL